MDTLIAASPFVAATAAVIAAVCAYLAARPVIAQYRAEQVMTEVFGRPPVFSFFRPPRFPRSDTTPGDQGI